MKKTPMTYENKCLQRFSPGTRVTVGPAPYREGGINPYDVWECVYTVLEQNGTDYHLECGKCGDVWIHGSRLEAAK